MNSLRRFSSFLLFALALGGCEKLLGYRDAYSLAPTDAGNGGSAGAAADLLESFPDGKLVFHRYTDANAGDAEMFVVELRTGNISAEIGATYNLCHPTRGTFSPDGRYLMMMASERTQTPCPPTDYDGREIFLVDLENPGAKVWITKNTVFDEEPILSPDGTTVAFIHAGHIAEWTWGSEPFTDCSSLGAGHLCYDASAGDQSQPAFTADGARLCYSDGSEEFTDIYCFDRATGKPGALLTSIRELVVERPGVFDGRPRIFGSFLYYQRWRSPTNKTDFIVRKPDSALDAIEEPGAFCSDEGSFYRDPCVVDGDVVVFSSNLAGVGGADLFVADFRKTKIAPLSDWFPGVNSNKSEYGASLWLAR